MAVVLPASGCPASPCHQGQGRKASVWVADSSCTHVASLYRAEHLEGCCPSGGAVASTALVALPFLLQGPGPLWPCPRAAWPHRLPCAGHPRHSRSELQPAWVPRALSVGRASFVPSGQWCLHILLKLPPSCHLRWKPFEYRHRISFLFPRLHWGRC